MDDKTRHEKYEAFIAEQVKLTVAENDRLTEAIKKFHQETCVDPSRACEQEFIALVAANIGASSVEIYLQRDRDKARKDV